MTPTRRDTFKMTAGTALAAIGMKPLTTTASAPAEPFDVDKYHNAWMLMTVAGGVDVSRNMDLADAMWNHFYGQKPLPAEYEPERQQCRETLLAVLARLDDPDPSAST